MKFNTSENNSPLSPPLPKKKKKSQDQMVSQENSTETREELTPSLIKVFQKMS